MEGINIVQIQYYEIEWTRFGLAVASNRFSKIDWKIFMQKFIPLCQFSMTNENAENYRKINISC